MDIMENALSAGATLITVSIREDVRDHWLTITITDNGRGIPEDMIDRVSDPFYTTKSTRRVGLGLSLFKEAARRCGGQFSIVSKKGEGTKVLATFRTDSIDLAPLGRIHSAMTSLIMTSPGVDFVYTHEVDGKSFQLDTRTIKDDLEGVSIQHPEVLKSISSAIKRGLEGLEK